MNEEVGCGCGRMGCMPRYACGVTVARRASRRELGTIPKGGEDEELYSSTVSHSPTIFQLKYVKYFF